MNEDKRPIKRDKVSQWSIAGLFASEGLQFQVGSCTHAESLQYGLESKDQVPKMCAEVGCFDRKMQILPFSCKWIQCNNSFQDTEG